MSDDFDDDEIRTAPWWIGFAFGMVFGGLMILMPVLITTSNMRCTVFGFQVSSAPTHLTNNTGGRDG